MKQKYWQEFETPQKKRESWAILKRGKIIYYSDNNTIDSLIRKWEPINPFLVGRPDSNTFDSPLNMAEFKQKALKKIKKNNMLITCGFLAYSLISYFLFLEPIQGFPIGSIFSMVFFLLAFVTLLNYYLFLRSPENLYERSKYHYWLYNNKRIKQGVLFWVGLMCIAGMIQLFLQDVSGDVEKLIDKYGVLYVKVLDGELWRLITGPFFHYNPPHFVGNLCGITLVGCVCWGYCRWKTFFVFMMANISGPLASAIWPMEGSTLSGAGISSGIDALFGYIIFSHIRRRTIFPKGFVVFVSAYYLISRLSTDLLMEESCSLAHFTGFVVGALFGLFMPLQSKKEAEKIKMISRKSHVRNESSHEGIAYCN